MALDVRERRANALSVGRPYMRDKFPDSGKGPEWRPSVAHSYGGNRLSPLVIITESFGMLVAGPQNIERGIVALASGRGLTAESQRGIVALVSGRGLSAPSSQRGLKIDEFE